MQRSVDTDFEAVHSGATMTHAQRLSNTMDLESAAKGVIIFEIHLGSDTTENQTRQVCRMITKYLLRIASPGLGSFLSLGLDKRSELRRRRDLDK